MIPRIVGFVFGFLLIQFTFLVGPLASGQDDFWVLVGYGILLLSPLVPIFIFQNSFKHRAKEAVYSSFVGALLSGPAFVAWNVIVGWNLDASIEFFLAATTLISVAYIVVTFLLLRVGKFGENQSKIPN